MYIMYAVTNFVADAHVLNQQNNFVFDKSNSSSFEFRFISKLFI